MEQREDLARMARPGTSASEADEIPNIGYLIRDTHRTFRRIMRARIAPFAITVAIWTHLWALWEEDGLHQQELAQRLKLERASVGPVIKQMERLGLVERRSDPNDRRIRRVYLTTRAYAMRDELVAMARGINEEVLHLVGPNEGRHLVRLLLRVREAAEELAGLVDSPPNPGR